MLVCPCSPPSATLMTSQLLRGLPRTKVLASSLLPCKQHQSQPGAIPHQPASRWPSLRLNCHSRRYNTTPVLHSYILTPPQVNSILKANEYSFKVCGFLPLYYNNASQIKTIQGGTGLSLLLLTQAEVSHAASSSYSPVFSVKGAA